MSCHGKVVSLPVTPLPFLPVDTFEGDKTRWSVVSLQFLSRNCNSVLCKLQSITCHIKLPGGPIALRRRLDPIQVEPRLQVPLPGFEVWRFERTFRPNSAYIWDISMIWFDLVLLPFTPYPATLLCMLLQNSIIWSLHPIWFDLVHCLWSVLYHGRNH